MPYGDWSLDESLDECRSRAQRLATSRKIVVTIFQLVSHLDATEQDTFFTVRRLLEGRPGGPPVVQWTMVDTREAAELLRDVSQGPTPFFGAKVEEFIHPRSE
jgi:hypothetical protein